MSDFGQDLRFGWRMLRKDVGASAIAVFTLALGIGANTAIFSVLDRLLIEPLPFARADRLVQLQQNTGESPEAAFAISKFLVLRQSRSFAVLTAYADRPHAYVWSMTDRPQQVMGVQVSPQFFRVFAAQPELGRTFSPQDERPESGEVVVLSHAAWQRYLGGSPRAIDGSVVLDGESRTIVGVMPESFGFPPQVELWVAQKVSAASQRQHARILLLTGRLAAGVSRQQAAAEMDTLNRRYLAAQGWGSSPETITLTPLQVFLHGELRPALLAMLAAVALVLLIACANVSNLQLARAIRRRREIAVRLALGARSRRIVRQLLTESMILTVAGAAVGILLCYAAVHPLIALAPAELASHLASFQINPAVFAFTLVVSLATGLLAGLAPAFQARRVSVHDAFKEGAAGAGAGESRQGWRLRHGLIGAEIALTVVLLVGAALLVKTFVGLQGMDPGFKPQQVLTLKLTPPHGQAAGAGAGRPLPPLLDELAALPGVQSAAIAAFLPFEPGPEMTFVIEGRYRHGEPGGKGVSHYRPVSPHYFAAMGIPLLRGRAFVPADSARAPGVLILNESAALRFFAGEDCLGQHVTIGPPDMVEVADPAPREIVGVVSDVREVGLDKAAPPILYVPLEQVPAPLARLAAQQPLSLVLRASLEPAALAHPVESKIRQWDPAAQIGGEVVLQSLVARSIDPQRFRMWLLGSFAAMALLLALVGVYGVVVQLVSQRRREIGLRMALGGRSRDITGMVMRQSVLPIAGGIVAGLVAARFTMRLLASLLFAVSETDLTVFATVPLLLLAVALLAAYLPARRALRVNPVEALREG
jgi:putative ABC transport system permease protein